MKMNEVVNEPKIWNFPGVPVILVKVLGSLLYSSTCAFHLSAHSGVALPSPGVSFLGIGVFFQEIWGVQASRCLVFSYLTFKFCIMGVCLGLFYLF